MPGSDPRDRFVYPDLILMSDSYYNQGYKFTSLFLLSVHAKHVI